MGYKIKKEDFNKIINQMSDKYVFFAPSVFELEGTFSDTDLIRYREISNLDEIEISEKSRFSFKDIILPMSETLFYYTEDEVKVPRAREKGALVFVRSCDLHGVKRLDEIYLDNGFEDFYYKRLRENLKFVVIGCSSSFENCFCVSMGSNTSYNYDLYFDMDDEFVYINSKWAEFDCILEEFPIQKIDVVEQFVTENNVKVNLPDEVPHEIHNSDIWEEYNSRCIACGRCNFVCPTCTCFTMQDVHYTDNKKSGERRRVMASCEVDGFTDMAGGHKFRVKHGERMRFKVLHKVYDFRKRFGYNMCVGCGRCDDVCPEYISFSNSINKLTDKVNEGGR